MCKRSLRWREEEAITVFQHQEVVSLSEELVQQPSYHPETCGFLDQFLFLPWMPCEALDSSFQLHLHRRDASTCGRTAWLLSGTQGAVDDRNKDRAMLSQTFRHAGEVKLEVPRHLSVWGFIVQCEDKDFISVTPSQPAALSGIYLGSREH